METIIEATNVVAGISTSDREILSANVNRLRYLATEGVFPKGALAEIKAEILDALNNIDVAGYHLQFPTFEWLSYEKYPAATNADYVSPVVIEELADILEIYYLQCIAVMGMTATRPELFVKLVVSLHNENLDIIASKQVAVGKHLEDYNGHQEVHLFESFNGVKDSLEKMLSVFLSFDFDAEFRAVRSVSSFLNRSSADPERKIGRGHSRNYYPIYRGGSSTANEEHASSLYLSRAAFEKKLIAIKQRLSLLNPESTGTKRAKPPIPEDGEPIYDENQALKFLEITNIRVAIQHGLKPYWRDNFGMLYFLESDVEAFYENSLAAA